MCRNRRGSFGSVNLCDNFQFDELTKSVRHSTDLTFSNACQRVRIGAATTDDYDLFLSRCIKPAGERSCTIAVTLKKAVKRKI